MHCPRLNSSMKLNKINGTASELSSIPLIGIDFALSDKNFC